MKAKKVSADIRKKLATAPEFGPRNASPRRNASMVMSTPLSPSDGSHAPVTTIARPVMVQMTMVSMNVPVMQTRPCRAGSFVRAAAAAIGAEPRPASLEKMPRATPFCIATKMVPTMPPVNADGLNAAFTISSIAPVTFDRFPSRRNMIVTM